MRDKIITWCIYAVIFTSPFSKSISEIAIAVSITFWIFGKITARDLRLRRTDLNGAFLVLIIAAIPSLSISAYQALSVKAFFTKLVKFVLFYFVIVENINSKARLKGLFAVGLASMTTILIDGFVQHYITGVDILHQYPSFKARPATDGNGFFKGFPTASFPFPNNLAAWILLMIFPILCVTMFDLKGKGIRYVAALTSLGLLWLFFLTKARGAWLGFALSVVYVALSKKKVWLIVVLIIIFALPFVLKMEMAQYIFAFGSVGDRIDMWRTGWQIFKNYPVIGNGINTFFAHFKEYRNDEWKGKKGSYAHNCYLQMACDTGLVGLGAFLWLMAVYFYSVSKGLRGIKDGFYNSILWGISIGVFAFLVHSFFDTNLYSLNLVMIFWTAIGVSQSIIKVSGAT